MLNPQRWAGNNTAVSTTGAYSQNFEKDEEEEGGGMLFGADNDDDEEEVDNKTIATFTSDSALRSIHSEMQLDRSTHRHYSSYIYIINQRNLRHLILNQKKRNRIHTTK
jgi:hypothetical protein